MLLARQAPGNFPNPYFELVLNDVQTGADLVDKDHYDGAYFEGRNSNYWWTIGSYGNLRHFPHWRGMLRFIREFKQRGTLLDIGCAYGFLVKAASARFDSYGIDVSSFAIGKSRRYCKGVISRASAVEIPFRTSSFDVVAAVDTLEHVQNTDICLKEIARVLKDDGILLLQLPNPMVWAHPFGRVFAFAGLEDETHIRDFRLAQWKAILAKHKLKVEKYSGMVAFAYRKVCFLLKSRRAAALFPEMWIVASK